MVAGLLVFLAIMFSESSQTDLTHLTILHSNDIHGNFAGDDDGYGGIPKTVHLVKKFKAASTPGNPVIYLNAGDVFTGTVWYSIHRTDIAADCVRLMKADALTLGNHEFDEGLKGLESFASRIEQPLLCANGNFSNEPNIAKYIRKSIVIKPNNTDYQIGVIGYINTATSDLTQTGGIYFTNDVAAVREEAIKLTEMGVKIIIALGHSGIETDKQIAKTVQEVDVVVGGHSHTFLYSGKAPTKDKIYGNYPVVVQRFDGVKVPVVQVGYSGKYLGRLNVTFDSKGKVLQFEGNPILLGDEVPEDEEGLEVLEHFRPAVNALLREVVGNSKVYLQGGMYCRRQECNFGNLLTDAFCEFKADKVSPGPYWTDTPIAIINGGALRNSINASKREGRLTKGDILGCLPFENNLASFDLNSSSLLEVLEFSVKSNGETSFGEFLQVSGLQVAFDMTQPSMRRVTKVMVRCSSCDVPSFEALKPHGIYRLVTTEYLAKGGDGYKILRDGKMNSQIENVTDLDVLINHLKETYWVHTNLEDRVTLNDRRIDDIVDYSDGDDIKNDVTLLVLLCTFIICQNLIVN